MSITYAATLPVRDETTHASTVLPDEPEPVTVLGIDEVRRGNPAGSSTRRPVSGRSPRQPMGRICSQASRAGSAWLAGEAGRDRR
jgi:hypothetical protein